VTWVGVADEKFEVTDGGAHVTWFESSPQSRRGFCELCGTTMFYTSSLSPGEVHIARACVPGEIDREPVAHIFVDHKVDWLTLGDGLPQLDSTSEALMKYREVE